MKAAGLPGKAGILLRRMEERAFRRTLDQLKGGSWVLPEGEDVAERIRRSRRKSLDRIRICLTVGLVLASAGLLMTFGRLSLDEVLTRPAFGEHPRTAILEVKASYRGDSVNDVLKLRIQPRMLSASEEEGRIRACAGWLPRGILGQNDSLRLVRSDLSLPSLHEETGVLLSWESSDPSRIDTEGRVDLLGVDPGETVILTALLSLGGSADRRDFTIGFAPAEDGDYETSLLRHLEGIREELGRPGPDGQLELPGKTGSKVLLTWDLQKTTSWLIPVPLCLLVAAGIYLSGLDPLKKEMKRRKREIEEELPNLSLQLTLLLNAGMVVTSAFDEILRTGPEETHPLYRILGNVRRQCGQTNEPFVKAFYRFSQTTGSRDFLRMATLIADHASRGSELAEKLERERAHLWEGRLQLAHARAKEVETKLCLPLMLLLCVLVVIAVAPAMMEM